jgi:hypothetical protein
MKLFICILGGIILASPCFAWELDPWSKTDVAMEAIYIGLSLVDWGQTLDGEKKGHAEINPWLGEHPSRARINWHFSFSIIGHPFATWFVPSKIKMLGLKIPARRIWQSSYVSWQAGIVVHNFNMGLGFNF